MAKRATQTTKTHFSVIVTRSPASRIDLVGGRHVSQPRSAASALLFVTLCSPACQAFTPAKTMSTFIQMGKMFFK